MTNRKGPDWEIRVTNDAVALGLDAQRLVRHGRYDQGDVRVGDWTVECKNAQRWDLAGWMDETLREQENAGTRYHALVVHRRGHAGLERAYVVCTGEQWARIVKELGA